MQSQSVNCFVRSNQYLHLCKPIVQQGLQKQCFSHVKRQTGSGEEPPSATGTYCHCCLTVIPSSARRSQVWLQIPIHSLPCLRFPYTSSLSPQGYGWLSQHSLYYPTWKTGTRIYCAVKGPDQIHNNIHRNKPKRTASIANVYKKKITHMQ